MIIWKNLYYRFYRLSLKISESESPRQRAIVIFSILQMLNVVEISTILSIITDKILVINWPRWILFLIGIGIIWGNKYYFLDKQNYLTIEQNYSNENYKQNYKGTLLVVSYVLLTISIFAAILFYLNDHPIGQV